MPTIGTFMDLSLRIDPVSMLKELTTTASALRRDRQVGENCRRSSALRHGEYGDVVPCRVESGIKTGVDTRIEPGDDGLAQQQCDPNNCPDFSAAAADGKCGS